MHAVMKKLQEEDIHLQKRNRKKINVTGKVDKQIRLNWLMT